MAKVVDRNSKILIVDGSGPTRNAISSTLREFGFTNMSVSASLGDAIAIMEVDPIDWILSPLQLEGTVNIFQLLNLCLVESQLQETIVTAFCSGDQSQHLLHLYEMGLFTHLPAAYSKSELRETFQSLITTLEKNSYETCLTSIDYLQSHMQSINRKSELLEFTSRLSTMFPGDGRIVLRHAAALAAANNMDEAQAVLSQLILTNPELKNDVLSLKERILPTRSISSFSEKDALNMLNIDGCVVVDPDETALNATRKVLSWVGAKNVHYFSDPIEAMTFLETQPKQSLIIHEWKMPKLTGPVFLQRIRQTANATTPVIIVSAQVSDRDQNLIHEMCISTIISKPFTNENFLRSLTWTMRQESRPTDIKIYERRVKTLIASSQHTEAFAFLESIKKEKKVKEPFCDYLTAEIHYSNQNYDLARDFCVKALKGGYNLVGIYHLFGKVLMKKSNFPAAIKCFEKAQEFSPLNIIRLCALAEANSEIGNQEAAKENIEKARSIDPTNQTIGITEANCCITFNEIKRASKVLQELQNFDDVLSYMNNRGISLARSGRASDAMTFYTRAIEALPEKGLHLKPFIHYNLALAHARLGELEQALGVIRECLKVKNSKVYSKAKSLEQRLSTAVAAGLAFSLNTIDDNQQDEAQHQIPGNELSQLDQTWTVLNMGPGDRCCFKLYQVTEPCEKIRALYSKIPQFRMRGAIQKKNSSTKAMTIS